MKTDNKPTKRALTPKLSSPVLRNLGATPHQADAAQASVLASASCCTLGDMSCR